MPKPILVSIAIVGVCFAFCFQPAWSLGQNEVTAEKVNAAINKCVRYLVGQQDKNVGSSGSWEGHTDNGTGQTSLVTLALLSAGEDPASAPISRALNFIRNRKHTKTYEASLKIMVLCLAEPNRDRRQIQEIVDWLIKTQSNNGGWGYGMGGADDESNTQFAVLALWEASKIGIEIDTKTLQKCQEYWRGRRKGEAWGYRNDGPSGSMTCAGIASMIILQDASYSNDASINGGEIHCCGGDPDIGFSIDQPLNWLARNFSVNHNPNQGAWTLYYLYALERVGRLTGQRFIGDHDWYREGSEFLLMNQEQNSGGSFRGGISETDAVTSSAMALLFLSKGKRQVVIGHLQYGKGNEWNLHRRSVQNLTGQIEKVWKRELAWQSIRIEKATLANLLETPVLFISGSEEFRLNDAQRKVLKEYVEQGGFIFAEACHGNGCSGIAFDRSFRAEMEKIFEKPLQKLPPSHPIWTAEAKVDPGALPKDFWLYGLDACCRTSVVYSPISLSCRWELARPYGVQKKHGGAVDGDILNAVKVGVNVAAYATGRELKEKFDDVKVIQAQKDSQSLVRGSLTVPLILHGGGAEEASRAVPNLMEVYRREVRALTEPKTPMVSLGSNEVEKYPILYIHGRSKFAFTEQELRGLRTHFENGGFVIGDAICGSPEFAESVRTEFTKALPESYWRQVPTKDDLMTSQPLGGFDLSNVTLIDPTGAGASLQQAKREGPAEIMALIWKDRTMMLFSPNDLSCAMESKHSMQCRGYVRDDAFRIGINMLLYGLLK